MSTTPKPPERSTRTRRTLRHLQFLTPTEVADRLLVAPVTVRQWAKRGLLPSETTPGGHRRFRERDVKEFIERRRQIQDNGARAPSRILIIDDDEQYARTLGALLAAPRARAAYRHRTRRLHGRYQVRIPASRHRYVGPANARHERLRGLPTVAHHVWPEKPRIVVLSGFLSEENKRRALEAGAHCCVSKTAPMETLLRELGIAPAAVAPPGGT